MASTKGTDADFFIVHFAEAAGLAAVTDVESEDAKEWTGRTAFTKANMVARSRASRHSGYHE